jgi:hypothetical protein
MTNETNYNGNKLTLSPKCDKTTQLPQPTTTSEDNNHDDMTCLHCEHDYSSFSRADPFITARNPCHEPICMSSSDICDVTNVR